MQADLLKFKIEDRKTMKRHRIRKEEIQMKESNYKSYDELPLFLNAATVAKVLGIAPSSSYELMHEKDFPALRIGNRIVVPKEAFIRWVEQHTGGTE
jgi:excisionase family DNA binding protein